MSYIVIFYFERRTLNVEYETFNNHNNVFQMSHVQCRRSLQHLLQLVLNQVRLWNSDPFAQGNLGK